MESSDHGKTDLCSSIYATIGLLVEGKGMADAKRKLNVLRAAKHAPLTIETALMTGRISETGASLLVGRLCRLNLNGGAYLAHLTEDFKAFDDLAAGRGDRQ
jgi:hypothetical protein